MATHVKKPASTALIPRLAVLLALLVMLLSAAGCQAAPSPTTEAGQEPGTQSEPSTSRQSSDSAHSPVEVPLSQHLRFDHLTTQDGLSEGRVWG
ncbi:MAG: hypothetical protein PVI80_23470, partial [Anaerolineae bacterium]